MNGAETQLPLSKRLLAALFAFVLVVGLVPVSAWADNDEQPNGETQEQADSQNGSAVSGGGESSDNADQDGTESGDTVGDGISFANASDENNIAPTVLNDSVNSVNDGNIKVKEYDSTFSNWDMFKFLYNNWKLDWDGIGYRLDGDKQYWPVYDGDSFVPKNPGLCKYSVDRWQWIEKQRGVIKYWVKGWNPVGTLTLVEKTSVGDIQDCVTYDGEEHIFAPTVKGANNRDLVQGSEYELNYYRYDDKSGNWVAEGDDFVSAGKIKVVVNFIGNFGDDYYYPSVEKFYTIDQAEATVSVKGKSDTKIYNGAEQTFSDFEVVDSTSDLYDIENVSLAAGVQAKGTNAATYPMNLNSDSFVNNDGNFKVSFKVIEDGSLVIEPAEVTVSVMGKSDKVTYDGKEHSVTGYDVNILEGSDLYDTKSITLEEGVTATVAGTNADTYQMELTPDSFKNADDNFDVYIKVTDGSLTIDKREVVVNDSATVTYNGQEQMLSIDAAKETGLLEGDTLHLNAQVKGTEPGTYTDVVVNDWVVFNDKLNVSSNYDLKVTGELTITKAANGSGSAADNGNTSKEDKAKTSSTSPQTGDSIAPFVMGAGIIAIAAALAAFFVSRKLRGTARH